MLRVVGALGDGWIPSSPFFPPEALPAANRLIDEAARAAGRSPRSIRRGYNIEGQFGAGAGFLYRAGSPDFLTRFAEDVAPAVREFVA